MKIVKSILINVCIVVCVYFAIHFYQTRNLASGAAPALSGVMVNGQYLSGLDALDRPAMIHFWASWCKICEFEHDAINRLSQDYAVVSIASFSGSDDEVRTYLANNEITYPVINDISNRVTESWGVSAFPTSFIIDEHNRVRFVEVGLTTEIGLRLRLWLAKF